MFIIKAIFDWVHDAFYGLDRKTNGGYAGPERERQMKAESQRGWWKAFKNLCS